jgi:hypothetical protein
LLCQLAYTFFSPFNKITITDLLASGCIFNAVELEENVPFLHVAAIQLVLSFYDIIGKFQPKTWTPEQTPSFTDKKLQKYIRKEPISEKDVKNVIFDLLTKANLNLDMIAPAIPEFVDEGPALSQLRQISQALAEYDIAEKHTQTI